MTENKESGFNPANPEWTNSFNPGSGEEEIKRFRGPKWELEKPDIRLQLGGEERGEEEDRHAWLSFERALQSPELRRISVIPYPEALRVETRTVIENMVQTPASIYDRYYWMRFATAIQERARTLERGRANGQDEKAKALRKVLRIEDVDDPSVYLLPPPSDRGLSPELEVRMNDEQKKEYEKAREKQRTRYENNSKLFEVLRKPLTEEYERLGKEFASVVKISSTYRNHWAGSLGPLAEVYIKTPKEFMPDADDFLTLFNAPPLIAETPKDNEGKPLGLAWEKEENGEKKREIIYPLDETTVKNALEALGRNTNREKAEKQETMNGNSPLGQNIDKVMRLCLLISLSEDGDLIKEWKDKTKDNMDKAIAERIKTIDEKRGKKELTNWEREEISKLNKIREDGSGEKYWRYLFGIENDDTWGKFIGKEDELKGRKDRPSEKMVYEENKKGIRGLLLENGDLWSLPRRGKEKDQVREYLIELMDGDELAVDIGMMLHFSLGTAARFASGHYYSPDGKMSADIEGFPYITEDIRIYNFDKYQVYKGLAAGPLGNESSKIYYGPLGVPMLKHITTYSRNEDGAQLFTKMEIDASGKEKNTGEMYAQYDVVVGKDSKGNDVHESAYLKVDARGNIIDQTPYLDPISLAKLEKTLSAVNAKSFADSTWMQDDAKSFFDMWQEGRRLGDLPWKETHEDPWRVWMLRVFFAGRDVGLVSTLTRVDWKSDELINDKFWEDFKLATKVNIRNEVIEDSEFWKKKVDEASESDWREAAGKKGVGKSIELLKKDKKVRVELIKNYIYKTWWEGVKSLPQFGTWQSKAVETYKGFLRGTEGSNVVDIIKNIAKKHGIKLE